MSGCLPPEFCGGAALAGSQLMAQYRPSRVKSGGILGKNTLNGGDRVWKFHCGSLELGISGELIESNHRGREFTNWRRAHLKGRYTRFRM
jgi:hypothetical protein